VMTKCCFLERMIQTMKNNDTSQHQELADVIIDDRLLLRPAEMNLDQFKEFFEYLLQLLENHIPETLVINLGDQAQIIFPSLSRQEIIVLSSSSKRINEQDFDFIPSKEWVGPTNPDSNFIKFLFGEIRIYSWRILLTFILSCTLLAVFKPDQDALEDFNSLLLQASSLFFSVYLIFTVSQSQALGSDEKLFRKGILYKYITDDQNITTFSITTIGFSLANSLLVQSDQITNLSNISFFVDLGVWVKYITTALVSTMLFHTFLLVSDYYLDRTRAIAERDYIGSIFHSAYVKHHPDENKTT
jgi:hypothetical protein